jgi:isopentenyl-diphosphate delta-isomerase
MCEKVILVNQQDKEIGSEDKLRAHELGALHRAFSIFIFNFNGEMLLQKRALHKYHAKGLWSNSCCGHPNPGEDLYIAASKRLKFEMGLTCNLNKIFNFVYKIKLKEDNLYEHEFDHVFVGVSNAQPVINPDEVASYQFVSPEELNIHMEKTPALFTPWFILMAHRVLKEHGLG